MENIKLTTESSLNTVKHCREAIAKDNDDLNIFLEVFNEHPNDDNGIPIAVKDNILIQGHTASASSRILENYTATFDATVITKLRKAGATFVGRTNMDEFAMGGSTENSAFGPTKNPIAPAYVPGGSSGGSAAAVSAGMVPIALGSDTGGSIRQPASFCGVVGLKPTYGAVSRSGLIAMGSSLDQIGPIATTVTDVKTVFDIIRGHDPLDSTTLPDETWNNSPSADVSTVGVPWELIKQDGVDPAVIENVKMSVHKLTELGYKVRDIEMNDLVYALSVYYIIMPAEVSANLARFDGVRFGLNVDGDDVNDVYKKTRGKGFGDEVRRRIMLGTYVLSSGYYDAYYRKALQSRVRIRKMFDTVFQDVDVIMLPTTPTPPFKQGEKIHDPLAMYTADLFTVPANIVGVPAISVPSGTVTRDGVELPLGVQFMGPMQSEERLFTVSHDFTVN